MRSVGPTYRFLSALILTAITWAIVLPVVHMACAMQPAVAEAVCEHESVGHDDVHADARAEEPGQHAGHHAISMRPNAAYEASSVRHHVDGDAVPAPPISDMSCCFVESTVLDRPATPAKLTDPKAMGVAVTTGVKSLKASPVVPNSIFRTERTISPSLPPPSSAELSVFLI